jgi:hypothetical protein
VPESRTYWGEVGGQERFWMGVGHSDNDGGEGYADDGRHDVRGKGDDGVLDQEADEHDQCNNCVKSGGFYDDQDHRLYMKMN